MDGQGTIVNQTCRFGAQQSDKLRAVDALRGILTNDATDGRGPINPPSRGHAVQMCDALRLRGEIRPLAIAKADRADAYTQLPLVERGELAAAVTRRNPGNGFW